MSRAYLPVLTGCLFRSYGANREAVRASSEGVRGSKRGESTGITKEVDEDFKMGGTAIVFQGRVYDDQKVMYK